MHSKGRAVHSPFGPLFMPNRPTVTITFGTLAATACRRILMLTEPQSWAKPAVSRCCLCHEVTMSIRIFLIDEHRPAREILARRLASMPGLDVVGSTCDGEEAIRDIAGLSPDVILIDTKMKRSDGIDLCRRAHAAGKQAKVAILTSYLDADERRQAYQAGVDGYLLKDVDTDNLANWIRLAVGQNSEVAGC